MRSSTPSAFAPLALLVAALAGTACSRSTSHDADDSAAMPSRGDDAPKAPPVTGTPDKSELTEAFGVFVALGGRAENPGTRALPLNTIQAGIELGKRVGKRVYVCAGTFSEPLVLADSISIIGGLQCREGDWKFGGGRTRIEAPASPAVRASGIASPTRLEALEIVSPNAKAPSGSSLGLLADRSAGLVIASSKIIAGDGANGVDGSEGTPLTQVGGDGQATLVEAECIDNATCTKQAVAALYPWLKPRGGLGGVGSCWGAPGPDGGPGGFGGSGGLFAPFQSGPTYVWHYYAESQGMAPEYGQHQDGTAGAAGTSGTPSGAIGALSQDGYVVANGVAGTDGAPGKGGFGGRGSNPITNPGSVRFDAVWRGSGGPGGGAGGCPGLAGTAGAGGGASIAVALVNSPIVLDGVVLVAGRAGTGGRGSFGSDPTLGGRAGENLTPDGVNAARPGGVGGVAGISTNGSNGPSVGVLHSGGAPRVGDNGRITPGPTGPAIDARTHLDALGNTKTIPATPAGIAKDLLAL